MSVEESVDQAPISATSEQQWQKVTPEKVLSNFQRKIDDTSLTNRRKHLKRLVELLAHDDLDQKSIVLIARGIFATFNTFIDRKSCLLVENTIKVLINHEKYGKEFIQWLSKGIIELSKKNRPTIRATSTSNMNKLIRWACLLLSTSLSGLDSQTIDHLISEICLLFGVASSAPWHSIQTSITHFQNVLKKNADLNQRAFKFVTDTSPETVRISAGIVLQLNDTEQNSEKCLGLLARHLFTELATESVLTSYQPIIMNVDNVRFQKYLLPAIDRSFKRNPELSCVGVAYVSWNMKNWSSKEVVNGFTSVLMPLLKSTDVVIVDNAIKAVNGLLNHLSDSTLQQELLIKFLSYLSGAKPPQRLAMIAVIQEFVNGNLAKIKNENLTNLLHTQLEEIIKSDVNEEVQLSGYQLVGSLLALFDSLPAKNIKAFETALSKDDQRARHLQYLAFTLTSSSHATQIAKNEPLLGQLMNIVKQQKNKLEVLSALRCLILISHAVPAIGDKMSDKGIWNVVFGCDSQFMTAAWLRKLNESELRLITHFVEVSIRFVEPKQRLNEFKNVSSSVYFALVHLLSCQFWRCRRSAFKLVSDLHKVYDELSHWLLIGWYEQLSEFVMPNDDSLQFLWASALMASVAVPNLKENDLALLFHLLHHRAISGESLAKSKCSLWKHALKQVKRDCDLTIHSLDGICRHLLGSNGILNANQLLSEAAFSGLATLIQTNPKCKVVLESELCQSLSEHAIKKLTDEQIGIYKTPEGQLFRKPESMDESNSSLSSSGGSGSSGEKRSKEQKKLYKASDEKWEQEIRKKMEEKHGKRKLTKEEELTLEQLSFEAQVRSEVSNIHKNCQRLLQAIETIFKASAHTSRHMIPSLFPLLMPFLRIETIALRVSNTIEVVCLSVDKLPKLLCMHVAYVIGLLYGNAIISHQLQLSKISEIHLRLLQLLVEPSSHTLPAPTFIVILPIVEHAIFHPTVYVAQDTSLSIIEKHLIKDPIYPFAQMSRALIHLLGTAPTLAMRAEKALVCLSEGFSAEHTVELLEGVISPFINVRCACLISLMKISEVFQEANELPNLLHSRVWFAKHDIDETNCQLAQELYEDLEPIQYDQVTQLFDLLSNEDPSIRLIAGSALAGAVKALNENENKPKIDGEPDIDTYLIKILANLFRLYQENLPAPPETDARGKVISVEDNFWRLRAGVAVALASMASVVNINDLSTLFNFLITKGPLNDYNEEVRRLMVSAGIEIVNVHGRENISLLLPIFEENLTKFNKSLKTNSSIVEGIIIFMGTLACFLEPASEKLLGIVRRLVAVKAPSDKVHRLVSERLTPLARLLGSEANQVIENLLNRLRDSSSVNDRRSAAFSLAGLVKGFGLKSFKQLNLIQKLKDLVSAKAANARVGALNAFECLSLRLGRLFEPYVMGILAQLLKAFGDTKSVREAAEAAAKAIMGQLSGHGVKLVLPYLLNSLKDTSNWRTVVAAIELLGSMAFCNPRQLSTCLPQIVAPINSLVNDSNENIQQSARESLSNVASVIRNPEIQAHVTLILNAMYDPKNLTKDALEALISTNYLHVIDAPSLALVVPILDRGLKDRSTSNKKLAAQIVGNMVNLTDHEVLEPYLNLLIPDLLLTLADSNPETRSIAAVALGNISKELGEARMPNLISTLIETMKSDAGTVQRSGAAQGLSQVMNGLSDDRFEQVFVTVVKNLEKKSYAVREGAMHLFVYLPMAVDQRLQPYLGRILPVVLRGLADEAESVREISIRAGQSIVNKYASNSFNVLLPSLEDGLFNDNWRIRQSSIQLLGDLLAKLTAQQEGEIDEQLSAAASSSAFSKALSQDKQMSVLSSLYLSRFDENPVVSQKSLVVWKSLVENSPKTLRLILPVLMKKIITCLGNPNNERQQLGSKCLGELVCKFGERILNTVVPLLEVELTSTDKNARQGVCMALTEVMTQTPKDNLIAYSSLLTQAVIQALSDSEATVRESGSQAFDTLFRSLGASVLDTILPALFSGLQDPLRSNFFLDGLTQVLGIRSKVILPHIIPKLVKPPVTASNCQIISAIATVSGKALYPYVSELLELLVPLVDSDSDAKKAAQSITIAIREDGLHYLIPELIKYAEDWRSTCNRIGALSLLGTFASDTPVTLDSTTFNQLLQITLLHFNDSEIRVQSTAIQSLDLIIKAIKVDNANYYISELRRILSLVQSDLSTANQSLPAFNLPSGLNGLLPVFLQGLRFGSPDIREQSALGIGDLITMTSETALKAYVAQIAGPLIRVIGDRFPSEVKAAILATMGLLLSKAGQFCKPFASQLQTTFIKSLNDQSEAVRNNASENVGKLMALVSNVTPLVIELLSGINGSNGGYRHALLKALCRVLAAAGKSTPPLTSKALEGVDGVILGLFCSEEDEVRRLVGQLVTPYAVLAGRDKLTALLNKTVLNDRERSLEELIGRSLVLAGALAAGVGLLDNSLFDGIIRAIDSMLCDKDYHVRENGVICVQYVFESEQQSLWQSAKSRLFNRFVGLLADESIDTKLRALGAAKQFAKKFSSDELAISQLVGSLVDRLKDRSVSVKLAVERALVHCLLIKKDSGRLDKIAAQLDDERAKQLIDVARRVISKLPPDSDDENYQQEDE